jgi:hypothetical protein
MAGGQRAAIRCFSACGHWQSSWYALHAAPLPADEEEEAGGPGWVSEGYESGEEFGELEFGDEGAGEPGDA